MCRDAMVRIIDDHVHDLSLVKRLLGWGLLTDESGFRATSELSSIMMQDLQREMTRIESQPVIPGMTGGDIRDAKDFPIVNEAAYRR